MDKQTKGVYIINQSLEINFMLSHVTDLCIFITSVNLYVHIILFVCYWSLDNYISKTILKFILV